MAGSNDNMWFRRGSGFAIEDIDAICFHFPELDCLSGLHRILILDIKSREDCERLKYANVCAMSAGEQTLIISIYVWPLTQRRCPCDVVFHIIGQQVQASIIREPLESLYVDYDSRGYTGAPYKRSQR